MNCNKSGCSLIFERNMGNVEKCPSHISNMPMLTLDKPIFVEEWEDTRIVGECHEQYKRY